MNLIVFLVFKGKDVFYFNAHNFPLWGLKHRLGEVGGFFGTKKVTALPSPRALTCYAMALLSPFKRLIVFILPAHELG